MRQKKQHTLRVSRIVGYVILFLLDLLLYSVLRSYFLLVIAVVMVVSPVVSIAALFRLEKELRFSIRAGEDTVVCGDSIFVELQLENPFWYSALDTRIVLKIENIFYGTVSETLVSMPVKMLDKTSLYLPLLLQDIGRIRIQCVQLAVQDMLGLICLDMKSSVYSEFCVIPGMKESEDIDISDFLAGATETEESHSKGSDYAEVSDIREYIPGDRIRDIHWKLSAKQDTLMVKERIAMAGTELVILLSFSEGKAQTQEMLEVVYGLGRRLIQLQLPVRLLCWNQRQFAFEEYQCGALDQLQTAFGEIFRVPMQQRFHEGQETYMRNCYPHLARYFIAVCQSTGVQVEMRENV